jgi:hypothetical protein
MWKVVVALYRQHKTITPSRRWLLGLMVEVAELNLRRSNRQLCRMQFAAQSWSMLGIKMPGSISFRAGSRMATALAHQSGKRDLGARRGSRPNRRDGDQAVIYAGATFSPPPDLDECRPQAGLRCADAA